MAKGCDGAESFSRSGFGDVFLADKSTGLVEGKTFVAIPQPAHLNTSLLVSAITPNLPTRMMFPMHGLEPVLIHVRVNLRGADVVVAQKFLHDAKVRAAADQVRGEAVAEGVG